PLNSHENKRERALLTSHCSILYTNFAMPRIGSGTKDHKCLVCCGMTTVAHMGVDVCRACYIFYRRSADKQVYTCRSLSNSCLIGQEGVNCRKCRFDRIERVLKQSGVLNQDNSRTDVFQEPDIIAGPSTASAIENSSTLSNDLHKLSINSARPILKRLRESYKAMSDIRFFSELNQRRNPPHPLEMKNRKIQFYPATFESLGPSNRIFLSVVLTFASSAFPEFDGFDNHEQWVIIMNLFSRFKPFESTYRADTAFPDHPDRTLLGYTTYIDGDISEVFLSDCPNAVRTDDFKRLITEMSKVTFAKNRAFMARLKPDNEEFLALLGIMFWSLEGQSVSEEAIRLSERYRAEILQELNVYYREELRLNDYAVRLGELLTHVEIFEKKEDMNVFYEHARLLNLLGSDDTFDPILMK
ncbi:hypothetical protein PENTCL1PPCAC_15589, partial [Pristionchus entomophagus]